MNKTWIKSQEYELEYGKKWMRSEAAKKYLNDCKKIKKTKVYEFNHGYANFFTKKPELFAEFLLQTTGRARLEVGTSVCPLVNSFWWTSVNYVIEPLLDVIVPYQRELLGYTVFDETINYSVPGEVLVPELVGKVDGVVVCRNCLDHTPQWQDILRNISQYSVPGAWLLLWNDLHKPQEPDAGHYNITTDVDWWRDNIISLGYSIINEYTEPEHDVQGILNYGCVAVRV